MSMPQPAIPDNRRYPDSSSQQPAWHGLSEPNLLVSHRDDWEQSA